MKLSKNFKNQIKPCSVVVERINIGMCLKKVHKTDSCANQTMKTAFIKRNKKFQLRDLSLKFKSYTTDISNEKKIDAYKVHVQLEKLNEKNIDKSNLKRI